MIKEIALQLSLKVLDKLPDYTGKEKACENATSIYAQIYKDLSDVLKADKDF